MAMQESVSIFSGIYWQIAFWVAGACVLFFITVFIVSKVKENIRDKKQGKNNDTDVIL